jgi:trehalose synthase
MLERVDVAEKKIESYRTIVDESLLTEIARLGKELKGLRVCHISSTPFGSGIPETLYSVIPLERDSGIEVEWLTMKTDERIARIGKSIHNSLLGLPLNITDGDQSYYQQFNRDNALSLDAQKYDVVIIHTPQLLPLPSYMKENHVRWVWRSHLQTSVVHNSAADLLRPYIAPYSAAIFSFKEFEPPNMKFPFASFFTPAIDPLGPKNRDLPLNECMDFASDLGVDPRRPILLYSSRIDQWKDPLGLIRCFYEVKDQVSDLQLVIIHSLTVDDPETFSILHDVDIEAAKDEDIHVFTNMDGFGDIETNAMERICSVGILNSLRESFGLFLSEIMWKKKPVLGSRVGGIIGQLSGELDSCMFETGDECIEKLVILLTDKDYVAELQRIGYERVRRFSLCPRLVRDELAFFKRVSG